MSAICSAGHRRRVEEVNEAVVPPRVHRVPHTSLDVLFNTAREALWQVPRLWGRLPPPVGAQIIFSLRGRRGFSRKMELVEDCGPVIKGSRSSSSSVPPAPSAERGLIPMQRGGEVKYCRAASAWPRGSKFTRSKNRPKVYQPTFVIK